jgi:hypothetical protein
MIAAARTTVCGAVLAALAGQGAFAQDPVAGRSVLPTGLSVEGGVAALALRDEFISRERYTGTLPSLRVTWSRYHGGAAFALSIEYDRSATIRNFNVSATITQFSLHQGFEYALGKFRLLARDVYAFLGPSAEVFLLFNEQHVAVANPDFNQSGAGLLSSGLDSRLAAPLGRGFQAECTMRLAVLSLGFRPVDSEENDISPVKLLTPLSGLHGRVGLGVRSRLSSHLSVFAAGRFHVLRISSWDLLTSVHDGLALGLTAGW